MMRLSGEKEITAKAQRSQRKEITNLSSLTLIIEAYAKMMHLSGEKSKLLNC
jgi:hypothetical protein